MRPAKQPATYADVEAAPEGMRAELIGDALYLQPRPRGIHQRVAGALYAQLTGGRAARPPGWVILPEVELHIPMVVVPDLSGWRVERFVEPLDAAYFAVVPDWVCEVLSPSTGGYDRGLKRRMYLERGVSFLWIADPVERTLEVFVAKPGPVWELHATLVEEDEVEMLLPFAAPLRLGDLWSL